MGDLKKISEAIDFMSWPERACWLVGILLASAVITVGPYEVAISLQARIIMLAIFLLIMFAAAYFRLRFLSERAEPQADVWLLDAFDYMVTGKWTVRPRATAPGKELSELVRIGKHIRQEAYDEKLIIWGRKTKLGVLSKIPNDYWEAFSIDVESLLLGNEKNLKTELVQQGRLPFGVCHYLKANKRQVEKARRRFR